MSTPTANGREGLAEMTAPFDVMISLPTNSRFVIFLFVFFLFCFFVVVVVVVVFVFVCLFVFCFLFFSCFCFCFVLFFFFSGMECFYDCGTRGGQGNG